MRKRCAPARRSLGPFEEEAQRDELVAMIEVEQLSQHLAQALIVLQSRGVVRFRNAEAAAASTVRSRKCGLGRGPVCYRAGSTDEESAGG